MQIVDIEQIVQRSNPNNESLTEQTNQCHISNEGKVGYPLNIKKARPCNILQYFTAVK